MELNKITDGDTVLDNCTVIYKLTCEICGNDFEHEADGMQDRKEIAKEIVEALTDAGWRDMESRQYNQIGFTCPNCIHDERHWEADNPEDE